MRSSSSEVVEGRVETAVEMVAPSEDQSEPLLGAAAADRRRPKINIFSLSSYPTPKLPLHKEQVTSLVEMEASAFSQFIMWTWSGSRYSGLLCMGLSSTIYWIMEVISDLFSAQSIPLLETSSVRCGIILILSFIWLRRNRRTMFGPSHARKFLVSGAVTGFISLLGFVYCDKDRGGYQFKSFHDRMASNGNDGQTQSRSRSRSPPTKASQWGAKPHSPERSFVPHDRSFHELMIETSHSSAPVLEVKIFRRHD